ncbi:MAG: hypothetical protein JWP03_1000 [Phycisphaerales bacterium]|nr:hypothetical protein [Phycisphaerales bacterium]
MRAGYTSGPPCAATDSTGVCLYDIVVTANLNYEPGKVIFRGEQRLRTPRAAVALVMLSAMAAIGAWLAETQPSPDTRITGLALLVGGGSLAITLFVAAWLDQRVRFEIRTDGIARGRRLVPWTDVRRLAACGKAGDRAVHLYFVGTWRVPHHLLTSRPLSPAAYEAIIAAVRAALGQTYPQLELGGYYDEGG